jgi:hypothetical protein
MDESIGKGSSDGIEWFALDKNYGSSYGDIHKEYSFKKYPKLLDLGKASTRKWIVDKISEKEPSSKIKELIQPYIQYSGGDYNSKLHILLKKHFFDKFDGTINDSNHQSGTDSYRLSDMDGVREITIWKKFTKLLRETKK